MPQWDLSALSNHVAKFTTAHPDATALIFSAYDTFSRVVASPAGYGFDEEEAHEAGGSIWFDHLHPTSAMHAIIAGEIADFLMAQRTKESSVVIPESRTSVAVRVGSHWPGLAGLKYLTILLVQLFAVSIMFAYDCSSGASYCDIGYDHTFPHPTLEQPLGVPFPGTTWGESDKANWVGHLVTRLRDQQQGVLVYDFAHSGDTVDGIERQINNLFLAELGNHPAWAPWAADDSLFCECVAYSDS